MTTGLWHRVGPLAAAAVLAGCGAAPVEHAAWGPAPTPSEWSPGDVGGDDPNAQPPSPGGTGAAAAEGASAPASDEFAAGLAPVQRFRSVRGHVQTPAPSSVRVPAIGVDSTLLPLGREPDGGVEVPSDWQRAGWFTEGARPGEPGPAVILGHVDSRAGPAVFYRLHELRPDDEILIDRADGSTVRFTVDRVEQHDKGDFPTQAVYYPTLEAALRLITCGGEFDRGARSYRDNIIVFATQAE